MAIELPSLPYSFDALEPHISARTLEFHYSKHHKGYVDKLNAALEESGDKSDLETLIMESKGGIFNNAAQIWNHTFYWSSLAPDAASEPQGALKAAIEESFGSVASAKEKLAAAAAGHFGSGWAWLVSSDAGLEIISTPDADNPLRHGKTPLLTIDVWEHAYYLDYQNRRPDYIAAIIDNLVNWKFAEENYAKL